MAEKRTTQITALRRAIDCLPVRTRHAMLAGIANNTIVVGAYSNDDGICPMLAAHRAGGRTSFVAFARAWDDYCFRDVRRRRRRARLATDSELIALRAHIEASLLAEEQVDLAGAVAEHRRLQDRHAVEAAVVSPDPAAPEAGRTGEPANPAVPADPDRVRPGDTDRSRELSRHHGWRWLRIMRSYDEYEQALAALEDPHAERELAHSRH